MNLFVRFKIYGSNLCEEKCAFAAVNFVTEDYLLYTFFGTFVAKWSMTFLNVLMFSLSVSSEDCKVKL